jgi:cytochrome oxidase Cu insertion factor (SCO1/SenC/PrrC family)
MKIIRPSVCLGLGSLLLAVACGKTDGKAEPKEQVVAPAKPASLEEKVEAKTELLAVGATAPDFTVQDHNGNTVSLAGLKGKPVVLYWYPKDETPG